MIASCTSTTGGSSSYSTLIRSHASSAISRVTAATAAIFAPWYLTLSPTLGKRVCTRRAACASSSTTMAWSEDRVAPVITAVTPGRASASLVSMAVMRAWAYGLRRNIP